MLFVFTPPLPYNPVKYGRATCLPHKGGGIPLGALPKDTTSKLAGLFSTLSLFMLSAKQGSCEYHFLKSFGMTRLRNKPQVYRLQSGRPNHCTIAPVDSRNRIKVLPTLLFATFTVLSIFHLVLLFCRVKGADLFYV